VPATAREHPNDTIDRRRNRSKVRRVTRLLYDPRVRGALAQVLLVVALVALGVEIVGNTITNLARQNIASGFDFLGRTAGFDISQSLIPYANTSTYARAFWVGLFNTLLVSGLGIAFATVVGVLVGLGRLSTNWLIARLATLYVEIVRNVPLLLQLFVWYFAVLKSLPVPRQSLALPLGGYLNVRGLYLPDPIGQPGMGLVGMAALAAAVAAVALVVWAERRQRATGRRFPALLTGLALLLGVPFLAFVLTGAPVTFDMPRLKGFNVEGGLVVQPEFLALLLGLTFYTASFIAEIVRSGIAGVPRGQKEAAAALGLSGGQAMRLVVLPQAMRVIIPPLTNQYLNLTKNSSLAVAIGYPDLVSVFAGTVLNQTNQALEVILVTMAVYLTLSLTTSLVMNWFNAQFALVER
jgi:general L-amino acid transport system permease protein